MRPVIIFALCVAASSAAVAQNYHYDYRTGNSYSTSPGYGGGATVRGFNAQTGSSWNTAVQPNGNMRGFDSKGNMWNYNKSSDSYYNSNGTSCFRGQCN